MAAACRRRTSAASGRFPPRYAVSLVVGGVSNALFNSLLLMVLYVMPPAAPVQRLERGIDGQLQEFRDRFPSEREVPTPYPCLIQTGQESQSPGIGSRQEGGGPRQQRCDRIHLTADPGAWYATATWIIGATVIGLAILAFKHSRAGAPTFGRLLEE